MFYTVSTFWGVKERFSHSCNLLSVLSQVSYDDEMRRAFEAEQAAVDRSALDRGKRMKTAILLEAWSE